MLPPRTIRPRRRGRPNTTQLLADYLEAYGYRGYEKFRNSRSFWRQVSPPAEVFDWLNALGVLIVLVLLAGGFFYFLRRCGLV
jgi:hypothetical protein